MDQIPGMWPNELILLCSTLLPNPTFAQFAHYQSFDMLKSLRKANVFNNKPTLNSTS